MSSPATSLSSLGFWLAPGPFVRNVRLTFCRHRIAAAVVQHRIDGQEGEGQLTAKTSSGWCHRERETFRVPDPPPSQSKVWPRPQNQRHDRPSSEAYAPTLDPMQALPTLSLTATPILTLMLTLVLTERVTREIRPGKESTYRASVV